MNDLVLNDFSILFDVMIEGIVVHNESGSISQFNEAALKILGLTSSQILGRTSYDPNWKTINEDFSTATPEQHPSTLARLTGEIQKNRIMGVHKPEGELIWVSISAVPIKNKSTPPYSTVVTFHEITELINLKKEIERKRNELNAVINSLPSLIGHWDKDLINVQSNKVYSYYFGKTPEQIKGLHIREVLGEKLFALNYPYMERVLKGEAQEFEREIPLPTGGSKKTIASYIPEIYDGKVIGFFVVVTDVTLLKKLEKERREMESHLFNSARFTWLGEMAGGMAHEINNPLAIIAGYLNMLKIELNSSEISKESILLQVDKIESTLKRISKIVKDLNNLSKDGSKDNFEEVTFSMILTTINNLMSETIKKKDIAYVVMPYKDAKVICKPVQITQVMMNLIKNSVDAISTTSEKWIKVSVSFEGDFLKVRITDSGKGIDHIADQIMDPFFTTKSPGSGTGLGLSISKNIMKEQNGDLNYIPSQENTTFELKIPIAQNSSV